MNFKFLCGHCGQRIEAPRDIAGSIVHCPACEQPIMVPYPPPPLPALPQPPQPESAPDTAR